MFRANIYLFIYYKLLFFSQYTRELFTREQESLNNILSKSGKLAVRTSANVGPAQKSPRIDETETKTTEDEITILDDKQVGKNLVIPRQKSYLMSSNLL